MIIDEKKIKNIRDALKHRFNAFIFRVAGPENLSDKEIQELADRGLIDPADLNHGLVSDAYFIGRIRSGTPHEVRPKVDLDEFRKQVERVAPPMTAREQYAIQHIKRSAGNYLSKLRDSALATIEGELRGWNYDERNRLLTEVIRPTVAEAVQDAKVTTTELASRLRERTGDLYRDWRRVAVTELSNALNLGAADAIMGRNAGRDPGEVYVYKIVHQDARLCPHCRKFYLDTDGTPKVYPMSELMGNGSNMGKKTRDWKPVIGATHPHERCELVELPDGWGFREGSSQTHYIGPNFIWAKRKN